MSEAPYVSSGGVELMRQLLRAIAVVALLAATAYWVNGLTVVGASVTVPVAADSPVASPIAPGRVDIPVAVALAAWLLYPVLGGLAQGRPFQRGAARRLAWLAQWSLAPLLLAGAVLVVAEAFRRGEQVSRDVEGLV